MKAQDLSCLFLQSVDVATIQGKTCKYLRASQAWADTASAVTLHVQTTVKVYVGVTAFQRHKARVAVGMMFTGAAIWT